MIYYLSMQMIPFCERLFLDIKEKPYEEMFLPSNDIFKNIFRVRN